MNRKIADAYGTVNDIFYTLDSNLNLSINEVWNNYDSQNSDCKELLLIQNQKVHHKDHTTDVKFTIRKNKKASWFDLLSSQSIYS